LTAHRFGSLFIITIRDRFAGVAVLTAALVDRYHKGRATRTPCHELCDWVATSKERR
jgi:hypothetical protein